MPVFCRLSLIIALLVAGSAHAGAPRLALWLDGKVALQLRPTIVPALGAYALVPPRQMRHAVEAQHAHHGAAALQRLRATTHADAVLFARVIRHGDRDELTLEWLGNGPAVATRTVTLGPAGAARATEAALANAVAELAGSAVSTDPGSEKQINVEAPPAAPTNAAPGPAPSPGTSPPSATMIATVSDAPRGEERNELRRSLRTLSLPPLFDISAGVSLGGRTLSYTDVVTTNLRTFVAGAIPLAALGVEAYPFARAHVRVLGDLGVVGAYEHSLYGQSQVAGGGGSFATTWSAFDAGLIGRLRLGERRPTIALSLVYGGLDFAINSGGQLIAGMPSVSYRYLRPALALRVPLGRVTLSADAGFLGVLSGGSFRAEFPRSRVDGIDVGLGLTVALGYGLQVRLGGRYSRFFYDLRPTPGDALVAGGALDEYATGELALAWSLR